MYELYGCRGCGSVVVEALLEWTGAQYTYHQAEPWEPGAAAALWGINPLAQVPTLKLADGTAVTESAAIIILLGEAYPDSGLLPSVGDARRAVALRWIVFIAGNMYPAISVGDFPERWVHGAVAREELKLGSVERLKAYWSILEQAFSPAPYLLGKDVSSLDIYAAMFSRWRPGRVWLDQHCPRVAASIALTEQHPVVARVWARNFERS